MALLKEKHEIENYEEKAKILRENGWETWHHVDNWVMSEWFFEGKNIQMAGLDTDKAYNKVIGNNIK